MNKSDILRSPLFSVIYKYVCKSIENNIVQQLKYLRNDDKGAFTRSNIRDDFSVLNHDDFSDLNQNVLFDVHTAA